MGFVENLELGETTAYSKMGIAALNVTSWDRSYANRYYTQRIKLKIRALKVTLPIDTRAQTVLGRVCEL